jgi:hypothetical protein
MIARNGFEEWKALFEWRGTKMELPSGSAEELLETIERTHELRAKQAALLSLAAHYPQSEQLDQALGQLLHDPNLGIVALGIIASGRLRKFLPDVQRILLEGEKHTPLVIEGALHALIELSEDTDTLKSELRRWAHHNHLGMRLIAARGLVKLGHTDRLKIIEHSLSSPVLNDRVIALKELAFLALPSAVYLTLLLRSLRSDFLLTDQQERWRFRMLIIRQIAFSNLSLRRQHRRMLYTLLRRWQQDSETALRALIDSLRDWHDQLMVLKADILANRVAQILSVIDKDNNFDEH